MIQYFNALILKNTLTTNSSNFRIRAVLSQGSVGKDKPMAFVSRISISCENNYSTIEPQKKKY